LDLKSFFFLEKLSFSAFQFGLLEVDSNRKQLSFKSTLCDSEIDICYESLSIWWNLNELISGSHIKAETWVVINRFIADLDNLTRTLMTQIQSENWEEDRLDAVYLLDNENFTKSNRQLKSSVEFLSLMVQDFYALLLRHERLFEPIGGLSSWINNIWGSN
jgi:hypothetical protein